MKILVYILSVTNAIAFTWIVQTERLNSKVPLNLPAFSAPVRNMPALNYAPPAELLPEIESFQDALDGGPQGELFPEVAEAKPKKRR
jgi:hypothetical protein